MTPTTLEAKVHDFLAQKRIAVVGVSRNNSHHPAGNLIYHRLQRTGHDVFPVNPHIQTFEGDRCYADLQSIPGGVDGVVVVTRPDVTDRIVHDCSAAGIRRVWMHQSMGKGLYAAYIVAFALLAIAVTAAAFRRGDGWAWWALLVGNSIAFGAAMTYDWIAGAIGPFEMSEYVGIAGIYGALAVTAPFVATGHSGTIMQPGTRTRPTNAESRNGLRL